MILILFEFIHVSFVLKRILWQ